MKRTLHLLLIAAGLALTVACGPSQAQKNLDAGFKASQGKLQHTNDCLDIRIAARKSGYQGHALAEYMRDQHPGCAEGGL